MFEKIFKNKKRSFLCRPIVLIESAKKYCLLGSLTKSAKFALKKAQNYWCGSILATVIQNRNNFNWQTVSYYKC